MSELPTSSEANQGLVPVRFEATRTFAEILDFLGCSILLSTYQAGKLVALGSHRGELTISFLDFDQAMGVAASPETIAVGTRRQIHFLEPTRGIAGSVEPQGTHDNCWSVRTSFYTGSIHGHDLAWGSDGLWGVNTLFSCLCTFQEGFNFIPRWRPKFISELAGEDRCHLNGMAMAGGKPRYVTVLAESNEGAGWRPTKATSGCVIDVDSHETIIRGLSMPHSPRVRDGKLYILNSGHGSLAIVEPKEGRIEDIERMPGYTRGLSLFGQFAFVGLSKIRETNVFGGLPISEKREELKCGVGIVDLNTGRTVATFQFHSGVEEIFAVEALPRTRNAALFGLPSSKDDPDCWIVPQPSSEWQETSSKLPPWRRDSSTGRE